MMKSVSCCCVGGRHFFSNPVTYRESIKLIVSWRSSSDEQAGRDHMKVFEKVVVKVNQKELVLNKLASYV